MSFTKHIKIHYKIYSRDEATTSDAKFKKSSKTKILLCIRIDIVQNVLQTVTVFQITTWSEQSKIFTVTVSNERNQLYLNKHWRFNQDWTINCNFRLTAIINLQLFFKRDEWWLQLKSIKTQIVIRNENGNPPKFLRFG